jgi:serralysin
MEKIRTNLFALLLLASILPHGASAEVDDHPISGYGPFYPDLLVVPLNQTFKLHSNKGAKHVIYLDFNGHTIIEGKKEDIGWVYLPMNIEGSKDSFSNEEKTRIQLIWKAVSEDFLPFEIDITTEEPPLADLRKTGKGDERWGVRAVISQYDDENGSHWSRNGSFTRTTDQELYVHQENGNEKNHPISIADAVSHEAGHTLGLWHDGQTKDLKKREEEGGKKRKKKNRIVEYYKGYATEHAEWSTIMGWSTWSWSQWDKGEYDKSTNQQDDLAIITSKKNGFGYRKDDHGSSMKTARKIPLGHAQLKSVATGIIERNTDVDYFTFSLSKEGEITLQVAPDSFAPNLYIKATLFDQSGVELAMKVPENRSVTFNQKLKAGKYYLAVEGTGTLKGSPKTLDGFSDYGSLGFYEISVKGGSMPRKAK